MQPRPADLNTLASVLPPGAIAVTFDLETCAAPGGDARVPGRLRIVQIALLAFSRDELPDGEPVKVEIEEAYIDRDDPRDHFVAGYLASADTYIDPGCRIDAGSQTKHHITDAQVKGAPSIADCADVIMEWTSPRDERQVYLVGYNLRKYDVPALAAELRRVDRADVAEHIEGLPLIDAMLVRRANEQPFTLEGSVLRYGLPAMKDAHHAGADCLATLAVVAAQAECGHLRDVKDAIALGTAAQPTPKGALDSQGKLRWVDDAAPEDGVPTPDNVVLCFGKHTGKTLRDAGPGFGKWVCGKDFDDDVKAAIRTAFGATAARW